MSQEQLPFDHWEAARVQNGDVSVFYRYAGTGPALVLLHGMPQHSLMWHAIGPILAEQFTVLALDQRGAGMSTISAGGYDGVTMASDLKAVLDQHGIESAYVVGYDFGARTAASFAHLYPERVKKVAFLEFVLAGFGYEAFLAAQPDWNFSSNWHLSLLSVADAGEWLIRGREREFLSWYFYHIAHAGNAAISQEHFERYAREWQKPGALRGAIQYYASVWQDSKNNESLKASPLPMPVLVMGGEASLGPYLEPFWSPVGTDVRFQIIPKAGHWISDENTGFTADALARFFQS